MPVSCCFSFVIFKKSDSPFRFFKYPQSTALNNALVCCGEGGFKKKTQNQNNDDKLATRVVFVRVDVNF